MPDDLKQEDSNEDSKIPQPTTPLGRSKRPSRDSADCRPSKPVNEPSDHPKDTRNIYFMEYMKVMSASEARRVEEILKEKERQGWKVMQKEEEGEEESELEKLVKEWMDELIELTIATPGKVTEGMLALRMCIQRIRVGENLSAEEELLLRDALVKVHGQQKRVDVGMEDHEDEMN